MINLRSSIPSEHVLQAFGIKAKPNMLAGGLHGVFLSEDRLLKHIGDGARHEWICQEILSRTPATFRLQKPLKSMQGHWTEDGWAAFEFLPGSNLRGHLKLKLSLADQLHLLLQDLPKPPLPSSSSPWDQSEHIVWGEGKIPAFLPKQVMAPLKKILKFADGLTPVPQVIHTDLCSNILSEDKLGPAIIDMTLSYRPKQYSSGILIYDSVMFDGGNLEDAAGWLAQPDHLKYLATAMAFRLMVTALFDDKNGSSEMLQELHMAREKFNPFLPVF